MICDLVQKSDKSHDATVVMMAIRMMMTALQVTMMLPLNEQIKKYYVNLFSPLVFFLACMLMYVCVMCIIQSIINKSASNRRKNKIFERSWQIATLHSSIHFSVEIENHF